MNCKYCNKVTNGNFGNGEFCDKYCARAFKRRKVAEQPSLKEEKKEIKNLSVEEAIAYTFQEISNKKKKVKKEE